MAEYNAIKIFREYEKRLKSITKLNGFSSDAGNTVAKGWGAMSYFANSNTNFPFCGISPSRAPNFSRRGDDIVITMEYEAVIADKAGPELADNLIMHSIDLLHALLDKSSQERLSGLAIKNSMSDLAFNVPDDARPFGWVSVFLTCEFINRIGGH